MFEYFLDARRVLRPGGVAVFSFLDFIYPDHVENFFLHAAHHRHGHGDLLTYTTKEVLSLFARRAGFSSHSFIDGVETRATSGVTSPLISFDMVPPTFVLGQSSCIIRV